MESPVRLDSNSSLPLPVQTTQLSPQMLAPNGQEGNRMLTARRILAYATISTFLVFILSYGTVESFPGTSLWTNKHRSDLAQEKPDSPKFPDFSRYELLKTLDDKDFPINDLSRRVIIVGDIHGMFESFEKLLKLANYSPSKDVLIHVGDIIAKGHHKGSMAVLKFMATHNVTGVRGNHDQKVVEWRGWIDWIESFPGGRAWLASLGKRWVDAQRENVDVSLELWINKERSTCDQQEKKWWALVPEGWKILKDHYKIARSLPEREFQYLLHLPLRLHVPSAHVFIAHAGLLPSDPRFPYHDKSRQPLARIPSLPGRKGDYPGYSTEGGRSELEVDGLKIEEKKPKPSKIVQQLRKAQEIDVLTQVPQNLDPWVVLNVRSILSGGKISRGSKKGKPWSHDWKQEMGSCVGYNQEVNLNHDNTAMSPMTVRGRGLPCFPSTIVYGHAASRGLDIKRWSIGLDTGCVYERELTALVIGGRKNLAGGDAVYDEDGGELEDRDDDLESKRGQPFPFGDESRARTLSVKCKR